MTTNRSNWLEKIAQKAMPLPFDESPHTDALNLHQHPMGVKKIDDRMTQETADLEKAKHPEYIGSGRNGMAVKFPDGTVGKYTPWESEAKVAKYILENKNNTRCVVKIYGVEKVQEVGMKTDSPMFLIHMEHMTTPTEEQMELLEILRVTMERDWTEPVIKQFYNQVLAENPQHATLIKKHNTMRICLKANRIFWPDANGYNFGFCPRGNLKLLDLGGIQLE